MFDTPKAAQIAAGTGVERLMSWQVEDADANRQGLTIAEFGEAGGPGMGGCPAGPAARAPTPGTLHRDPSAADPTKIAVTWSPATAQPGATAVTGLRRRRSSHGATARPPASATGASATGATLTVTRRR